MLANQIDIKVVKLYPVFNISISWFIVIFQKKMKTVVNLPAMLMYGTSCVIFIRK